MPEFYDGQQDYIDKLNAMYAAFAAGPYDSVPKTGGVMTGPLHLDVPLEVASGGTGSANKSGARNALGMDNVSFDGVFHIFDGESTNSPAAGGTGWVEVCLPMRSFARRSGHMYAAVPGRNMAATWAAYPTAVRPTVLAKVAAGIPVIIYLQTGLNDYGLGPVENIITPWDAYVAQATADGATIVAMTTTRRLDWRDFDDVRKAFNAHIYSKHLRYTIDIDNVFTDPNFTSVPAQTDDGTHPNAEWNFREALYVNESLQSGGSLALKKTAPLRNELQASRLVYTNYSGQLATDNELSLELGTGALKNFVIKYGSSFGDSAFVGSEFYIPSPGLTANFRFGTVGPVSPYPGSPGDKVRYSAVITNEVTGGPLAAFSHYQPSRIFTDELRLCRAGLEGSEEVMVTIVPYPTANNTPGRTGQIATNYPTHNKIAVYVGDGVSDHKWAVSVATNNV